MKCAGNEIFIMSMKNIMRSRCFICCDVTTSCKLNIMLVNENIVVSNKERERKRGLSVRWRYLLKEKDVRFRDAAKMMWCLTVERNEKSSWWQLNGILDIHVITWFTKMCIFLDSKFNNNWITRNLPFSMHYKFHAGYIL